MALTAQQKKDLEAMIRSRQQAGDPAFAVPQEQQMAQFRAAQPEMEAQANDAYQKESQTARALANKAAVEGLREQYGPGLSPEDAGAQERTRLAQSNQPKGPVSAPPPNPAKPGLGRLKPGLFSSQDNAKQEVPTLSEMINPNLSRFQKSGGTQGVVGLTDTQSTEQQPVKPPLDVPAGEPSLRPEPPSQVPGTTGVPASSKEKVTAAIKEKQQKATLPATTDVKNTKKPFNIDPWLRFGSDIFGATAGRGTGRVDKFIDESNAKAAEAQKADPNSKISLQWQKRAKLERPEKDWSGIPASIIEKEFPKAPTEFNPYHGSSSMGPERQERKDEMALRKEYLGHKTSQETALRQGYAQTLHGLVNDTKTPTGANDVAIIFAYMKMLDPMSVVREAEQATAANVGSVPQNVWKMFERARSGQKLDPSVRANFVSTTDQLMKSQLDLQKRVAAEYQGMASHSGLDPKYVVPEYSHTPPVTANTQSKQFTKQVDVVPKGTPVPAKYRTMDYRPKENPDGSISIMAAG